MTRERRTDEPRRWAPQLRGIALVAALAIVSSSLLPLVHGAASHLGDCGVCSLFAHDAGGAADLVATPDVEPVVPGPESVVSEPEAVPPRADFGRRSARAPPAPSIAI